MKFRTPVTLASFALLGLMLSGCIAYDAASAVVSVGSTAVDVAGDAVSTAGDVVTSPFDRDDSDKRYHDR